MQKILFGSYKKLNYNFLLRKVLIILAVVISITIYGLCLYSLGCKDTIKKVGKAGFTENGTINIIGYENKYSEYLEDEYSKYIVSWCQSFELDPDIAIAILLNENPLCDPGAISPINKNGSVDCGLFQISSSNSSYFEKCYWKFDFDFDIFNWQHNSYLAIRHIRDLSNTFNGVPKDIAAAYNCGTSRTMTGRLPKSTKKYVDNFLTIYNTLKGVEK